MATAAATSGKVAAKDNKAQHVDLYRKILLRRKLLALALPGPAYVPFIGDGDIAAALYSDRFIYGADLDPARVATAAQRFTHCKIMQGDCNAWPFAGQIVKPIAVADFDAYSDPYAGFRSFWAAAPLLDRLVVFFTDGHLLGIKRSLTWHRPDGSTVKFESVNAMRLVFNSYYYKYIGPWFAKLVKDWRIVKTMNYLRGGTQLYWGAVIER